MSQAGDRASQLSVSWLYSAGIPTGGSEASCGGKCDAPNMSYRSCRFWFTQPAANTVQATWVKRKDAAATTRQ